MASGLYKAVQECRFKQLHFLVESGLTVNQKNAKDQHTLVAALQIEDDAKRSRMFKYLIRHKADSRAFDSKTERDVFLWACFLNRTKEATIIMNLIEEDMDFKRKDIFGRTSLHYATMRGNNDLLKVLCQKMARYELSVDVRDSDGFTPFLLAKRLGFEECVDTLVKIGHASPYQFDQRSRKMGHDWENEGMREHYGNLSVTNKKQVSMYKALGRLPALRRASFDASQVSVVASKKDRHLLARAERKENLMTHKRIEDFSRLASKNPKRSMSLGDLTNIGFDQPDYSTQLPISIEMPSLLPQILTTRSASPPPSHAQMNQTRTNSVLTMASTDEALRLININTPLPPSDDTMSNFSSPRDTYRSSIAESIPEMMTIVEEQCTDSFRAKAKPKPKESETRTPTSSPTKSTLAIIFGKDGSRKILKKEVKAPKLGKNRKLSMIKETA